MTARDDASEPTAAQGETADGNGRGASGDHSDDDNRGDTEAGEPTRPSYATEDMTKYALAVSLPPPTNEPSARDGGGELHDEPTNTPTSARGGGSVNEAVPDFGERYTIRERLGAGGMGTVYRAYDRELGLDVALKVVNALDHDVLRDEVRLAQRVTHKNVCRTFDLVTTDQTTFLKMEYVAGETLWSVLARERRLSVERAITIALDIAEGLAAAHAVSVVHRDLKPANVLLAPDRTVLMDFGLARLGATLSDQAGTPGYMSPEQLRGESIDQRTDLYALGCILYEMLVGAPVFGRGSAIELAARHAVSDVPAIERSDVPRWLAGATRELLSKTPARRVDGLARLRRGPSRRWIWLPAIALLGLGVAIAAWPRGSSTWLTSIRGLEGFAENANAATLSPDGHSFLYVGLREGASSANIYASDLDIRGSRALLPVGEEPRSVRWSEEGDSIVYTTAIGTLVRRAVIDGDPKRLGDPEVLGRAERADPCGPGRLVFVREGGLMLLDGTAVRPLTEPDEGRVAMEPRCSRDGKRVVYSLGRKTAEFDTSDIMWIDLDATPFTPRRLVLGNASLPTFDASGESVIYTRRTSTNTLNLAEVMIATGETHAVTTGPGSDVGAEVSSDGRRLLFNRDITSRRLYRSRRDGDRVERTPLTFQIESLAMPVAVSATQTLVVRQSTEDRIILVETTGIDVRVRDIGPGTLPIRSSDPNKLVFVSGSARDEVHATSLDANARPTLVAKLPGTIVHGIDSSSGTYVVVDRGRGWEAFHVHAGKVSELGTGALVYPRGDGPIAEVRTQSGRFSIRVIAGGRTIERIADSPAVTWIGNDRVAYFADNVFRIMGLDGTELDSIRTTIEPRLWGEAALGADGVTWLDTAQTGSVTRFVIDNFGSRPWRPKAHTR
ncbi:MAG: protein kinase domain-containing protein [Kofleriaceae bacterium]